MTDSVQQGALNASNERASGGFSGYLALGLMLASLAYGIWALSNVIRGGDGAMAFDFISLISAILIFTLMSAGFYMIQPNQAVAITLFGPDSGAALATVVGVLVEVPVMLSVCAACNRTRHWFPAPPALTSNTDMTADGVT